MLCYFFFGGEFLTYMVSQKWSRTSPLKRMFKESRFGYNFLVVFWKLRFQWIWSTFIFILKLRCTRLSNLDHGDNTSPPITHGVATFSSLWSRIPLMAMLSRNEDVGNTITFKHSTRIDFRFALHQTFIHERISGVTRIHIVYRFCEQP